MSTVGSAIAHNTGAMVLPPRVLLVDDEPFNLDLLEQELTGSGVEIRTALNGRLALEMVEQEPPDMIFLDLMMPVLDGFGVLETLQAHEEWRNIPVIIISASGDLENIVRGIEMGAVDFLPKPFEPRILLARLEAGLERKRLRDLEQRYLKSLERELEIGREIQAGFLPTRIPQPGGWSIQAHFQAAREVAGDFYDVFEVSPGKIGLLVGDVTDKGVGSALYMALYRTILRSSMLADAFALDPATESCATPEDCLLHAVQLANRYIIKLHDSAMLATLFFAVVDTESGELCYVNAGHDPPFHLREGTLHNRIPLTGPIVGAIDNAVYRVETVHLEAGDTLVLYSDGIPDAESPGGERFGGERFLELLQSSAPSPAAMMTTSVQALEDHLADGVQFDDITLLIVHRD